MALTPQSSLLEITMQVLEAIGEGGEGVAAPNTVAMVQSLIRRHQTILVKEAPWTINRTRIEVALSAGVTVIDFPDGMEPGDLETISARKASNPQDEWQLEPGIRPDDRAAWLNQSFNAVSYNPYRYDFLEGEIEVGPACTEAITLFIQGRLGKASMVEETDRPNCDATALAMKAEIAFRNARGGDFRQALPRLVQEFEAYLELLKPQQGTRRGVVIGGAWNVLDPARRRTSSTQRHWAYRDRRP